MGTGDRAEAKALLNARNESVRQPQLNRQIAQVCLAETDSGVSARTWRRAFDAIIEYKRGATKDRLERDARQQAFGLIHKLVIIETQSEQLLASMKAATVSTNILLRELQQLLFRHELALLANHSPAALAKIRIQIPAGDYRRRRAPYSGETASLDQWCFAYRGGAGTGIMLRTGICRIRHGLAALIRKLWK